MPLRLLALLVTVALTALAATTALAHRAPTRAERAAIVHAVRHSRATKGVPCYHVRQVTVSTRGPWSRATLVPCDRTKYDGALVVLRRRRHGRWALRDLGTSEVGCSSGVPRLVRTDLKLVCP